MIPLFVFIISKESETNYVFTCSNKEINNEFGMNSKKTGIILDVFSNVIQGILPYGVQVMLILSYANG